MPLELTFVAGNHPDAQRIGILIIQKIQEVLSGPRHGRYYPMPGNMAYDRATPSNERADNYWVKFTGARSRNEIAGAAYQASAPGEPPAVRTGRLRQSFYMVVGMEGENNYRVTIKTNVIYADDMEYGTERIAPRPFLDPAIQKAMPEILEIHKNFIYRKIRGEE